MQLMYHEIKTEASSTIPVICSVAGVGAAGAAGYLWHITRSGREKVYDEQQTERSSCSTLDSEQLQLFLDNDQDDEALLDELSRHLTVASVVR